MTMYFSKELLVEHLIKDGYLKTPTIIEAFRKIDRKDFVLPEYIDSAYIDEALPIGFGQTISQPLTVAFMFELLAPKSGDKILDIGSGSAWTTALLAQIVGFKGKVIGVEKVPELVEFGKKNLERYKFKNVKIIEAGDKLGFPSEAPFDKILVSAAADELPREMVGQLKIGGRMVIPIAHSIWKIDKVAETEIKEEEFFGFSFVPLVRN